MVFKWSPDGSEAYIYNSNKSCITDNWANFWMSLCGMDRKGLCGAASCVGSTVLPSSITIVAPGCSSQDVHVHTGRLTGLSKGVYQRRCDSTCERATPGYVHGAPLGKLEWKGKHKYCLSSANSHSPHLAAAGLGSLDGCPGLYPDACVQVFAWNEERLLIRPTNTQDTVFFKC